MDPIFPTMQPHSTYDPAGLIRYSKPSSILFSIDAVRPQDLPETIDILIRPLSVPFYNTAYSWPLTIYDDSADIVNGYLDKTYTYINQKYLGNDPWDHVVVPHWPNIDNEIEVTQMGITGLFTVLDFPSRRMYTFNATACLPPL